MFEDLLVVETASVLAGPSVGQFFAELGATVIKVENPRTRGDVTRQWRAPGAERNEESDDRSAYFSCCNQGKKSIALNLVTEVGQDLLHTVVREADVFVASYRPGSAQALGADYATLSNVNPSLVYGHVTGYGPDRERAGYDAIIQAESGFMHMNGPPDGPPTKLPVAIVDVLAAHQLKEGLLVALLRREQEDEGTYVPVSLFEAAVSGLTNQATNWLVAGHVPQRIGSAHPSIAPYGTPHPTADGKPIVYAIGTERQFEALCEVLEVPELAEHPKFARNADRVEHRDDLDRTLRDRTAQFRADELLDALHSRHVPAGIVRDMPAVFDQPAANEMVLESESGPPGLRQTAFPHPDDNPPSLLPAPHYAEHTDDILQNHVGISSRRRDDLADEGVVERGSHSG